MDSLFSNAQAKEAFQSATSTSNFDAIVQICSSIVQYGYSFLPGRKTRALMPARGADDAAWQEFSESWNRLGLDQYMRDGGRYRSRRHAVYSALSTSDYAHREPNQPHYQSLDYNHLNGGIARHYLPIEDVFANNAVFLGILGLCCKTFGRLRPKANWHIKVHQFRIEANQLCSAQPTPEGVHRDGVHYVLMMMVKRQNIINGETDIFNADGARLGRFLLADAWDAAIVDDEQVRHGVTPIVQLDTTQPGLRDVLVITFRDR
jgi:hypothetical protein